jgi:hypothetical protein
MKTIMLLAMSWLALTMSGCTTLNYPSPMTEAEVYQQMSNIDPIVPKEKIYRQYVSDGRYFQFERMDENNVIYGWFTCTDCTWTRSKMLAVYDGSYMYVTYGHHEDFFLESPTSVRQHPDFSHWSWSSIDKFQVEGRNLIKLGQIRKCTYMTPYIREWTNTPWSYDGEYDCTYQKSGTYNSIYVATIDETLTGERSSIVGAKNDALTGDISEKLKSLKTLLEQELITDEEYQNKRKEVLDSL